MGLSEKTGLVHRAMYDQALAERDEARAEVARFRARDEAARRTAAPSIRTLLLALEIVTVQRDAARKEVEELRLKKWGI